MWCFSGSNVLEKNTNKCFFFLWAQILIIMSTYSSWHCREILPARNSIPGSSTKHISEFSFETKDLCISSFLSPSKSNSCSYSLFLIIWICCVYLFSSPTFFKVCKVLVRLCRPCQAYLFLARRLTMCRLSSTFTISYIRLRSTSKIKKKKKGRSTWYLYYIKYFFSFIYLIHSLHRKMKFPILPPPNIILRHFHQRLSTNLTENKSYRSCRQENNSCFRHGGKDLLFQTKLFLYVLYCRPSSSWSTVYLKN